MQTPDQLADTAAFVFGVDKRSLFSGNRTHRVVEARQALAWALRQQQWSLVSIGAFLRRDHTTIIYAIEAVERLRGRNTRFAERLAVLAQPIAPPAVDWQERIDALERRVTELEQRLTERN